MHNNSSQNLNPSLPAAWKIFGCTQTSMPPNQLLLVKLIAFTTLIMAIPLKLPEPFAPFFSILDSVPGSAWQRSLQLAYLAAAASLFCNRHVRISSAVLGIILLLAISSSRLFYSNGKFYCALIFLLSSLERPKGRPWLLHCQLALIYFGAALNKLLDPDWQSGHFMNSLMNDVVHSSVFPKLAAFFPQMSFAQMLCWGTILIELLIGCLVLRGRSARVIIWTVLSFHGLIYFLTGTFYGTFVPAVAATLFSLVTWPSQIDVFYRKDHELIGRFKNLINAFDFDNLFHWQETSIQNIQVSLGSEKCSGLRAIQKLLLFLPATYFLILFFFVSPRMSMLYSFGTTLACLTVFSPLILFFARTLRWAREQFLRRGLG